jgi:hypothetical protein
MLQTVPAMLPDQKGQSEQSLSCMQATRTHIQQEARGKELGGGDVQQSEAGEAEQRHHAARLPGGSNVQDGRRSRRAIPAFSTLSAGNSQLYHNLQTPAILTLPRLVLTGLGLAHQELMRALVYQLQSTSGVDNCLFQAMV